MANANISQVTLANTFNDWRIVTNNLSNTVNELRNGTPFYKDGGGLTLANGAFVSLQPSGTGLSITANSVLGGTLTSNTIINTGDASILGNNFTVSSPNGIVNVANTIYTNNLFANNLTVSGNAIIQGTTSVTSDRIVLRSISASPGTGYFQVHRGNTMTFNEASLRWNEGNNNWEVANVTTNVYSGLLSTANLAALPAILAAYGEGVTSVGVLNTPNTYVANLANTNVFDITLANTVTHDITIQFAHALTTGKAQPIKLILRQSAAVANSVTFANTIKWSNNVQPTLSNGGVGNVDIIQLVTVDGGLTFIGSQTGGGGASSNAVNTAANTTSVTANNITLYNKSLKFINTASVTVVATANGGNADIRITAAANLVSNVSLSTNGQSNFIMAAAPFNNDANLVLAIRNGLVQAPNQYNVAGNVLTFTAPCQPNEVVETRVISVIGGAGDSGGGGGTSKVQVVNANSVVLGTQSANQTSFTWYTVPSMAARGIASKITLLANTAGLFQFQVAGAVNSANQYLAAAGITDNNYSTSIVWYYESDVAADENLYIGIMNQGGTSETFRLDAFRIEKFA